MPNRVEFATDEEIALYDAIERAIIDVHAALAEIDAAWSRITAERPYPSTAALAALDKADAVLVAARDDLNRARRVLTEYTQAGTQQ